MAPIRIGADHFSPDTRAFIEQLAAEGVCHLTVGGEAVILHGHVRLTGDVDFFSSDDSGNVWRLFEALRSGGPEALRPGRQDFDTEIPTVISDTFCSGILQFTATGDWTQLPDTVWLPPVGFRVPDSR